MNQSLKIILLGLTMCIITYGLMLFIDNYLLMHLGEWTMAMSNKFLVFNWTIIDRNLIRWFPLVLGFIYAIIGVRTTKLFIMRVLLTLVVILAMILVAIVIGLFTWKSGGGDSPWLPEYLKYQPFTFYWTLFISIGIILPIFFSIRRRLDNYNRNDEILDK